MPETNPNQKMAVVLADAERRKAIRKAMTFNAYAIKVDGMFTLPFYSRDDRAAIAAYQGMVKEAGLPSSELMIIGYYHADTAKFMSKPPKVVKE